MAGRLNSGVRPHEIHFVKYKNIDSALHNFGHSFISLMNYVDDEYVGDLLLQLAKADPSNSVTINFSSGAVLPPTASAHSRLRKSIEYWGDWLPKHLESQNVRFDSLSEITLVFRLTNKGTVVSVDALDDRGVHHSVSVRSEI